MSNLESFDNIFANLAESSYTGRPNAFSKYQNSKEKVEFDYSLDTFDSDGNLIKGGKNLPNKGIVYLQPDNTVKTVEETNLFGRTNEYKKGLLTDEKAGFNAYYVTDTPALNQNTKHTYFAIRGSDGGTNDWINNNAAFTVGDAHIPQAKLATEAMRQKITELRKATPDATMSVTGHSLGTMVSIQGVANLSKGDISKIDKVILFQGPDARESINKMSKQAQKNIRLLEEQGKIEYYVNAFDIVSMLNRNKKGVDEIGKVHYLLPKTFTSTFEDIDGYPGSSHDFGQYQLNPDGTPKVANLKEHPYIFSAGIKLSNLIDKYLKKLLQNTGIQVRDGNVLAALAGDAVLFKKFMDEYDKIVAAAKVASKWQGKVSKLQEKIGSASGSKKIELRAELASAVSEEAKRVGDEYMIILKNEQQEALDEITTVASEIKKGANAIRHYLSYSEVQQLISPYKKSKLWDSGQETINISQAKQYKEKVTSFSEKLSTVANNIQDYDGKVGQTLFK